MPVMVSTLFWYSSSAFSWFWTFMGTFSVHLAPVNPGWHLHKYLEGFERSFTMKHSPPFTQKVFSFSAHFTRWLVPVVDVDVDEEVFAPSVDTDILMGDSEDIYAPSVEAGMPVMISFESTMVILAEALSFPNLLITLHIYSPESASDALLMRSSDFPGFFCILMFCGLFFRFNSFPFLNHLNLREEYSELVSHRRTSLEPAADSWLFISFNRGGKAGLWLPAADSGFLPEPRSFLPFPLPLPSLRSDISPET